jgi:hypothetical protein
MSSEATTKKNAKVDREHEFATDIITKIPNLELAQLLFLVKDADLVAAAKADKWTELLTVCSLHSCFYLI